MLSGGAGSALCLRRVVCGSVCDDTRCVVTGCLAAVCGWEQPSMSALWMRARGGGVLMGNHAGDACERLSFAGVSPACIVSYLCSAAVICAACNARSQLPACLISLVSSCLGC